MEQKCQLNLENILQYYRWPILVAWQDYKERNSQILIPFIK